MTVWLETGRFCVSGQHAYRTFHVDMDGDSGMCDSTVSVFREGGYDTGCFHKQLSVHVQKLSG